jgi:general secretion pathway protein C
MEALFKRHFWIVKTLGIAVAAGLAASAVATGVGSSVLIVAKGDDSKSGGDTDGEDEEDDDLAELDAKRAKTTTPRAANTKASKDRAGEQVRKYNIFCPSCAPPPPEPGVSPDGPTGAPRLDAQGRPIGPVIKPGEVKSGLPLRLQATMESVDPELSLATVFDAESGSVGIFGVDDVIRPGVVVMSIEQGMLHMRNNAALEYLEIGGVIPEPAAKPAEAQKEETKPDEEKKDDRSIPGAEDSINCPNENLCIVERSFVESLLANPMQLAKQARIVPAKEGEVGFKFYGIRRGSLPKLLGLKNGDKLVAVNGEDLTGIDQAMGLYTKLRRASNLQVTIERKGKTINKEIQIQ